MKKLIHQTELNLNVIENEVRKEIDRIGSTKAAFLTDLKKAYLTDWKRGRINMSYNKIIEIAKNLFDID